MGSVPKKGTAYDLAMAIATMVMATTTTMAELSDAEKALFVKLHNDARATVGKTGWVGKPADAIGSWVGEKPYYDHRRNSCAGGKVCGHYTQVIGCARVTSCNINGHSNTLTLIACNYNPCGNIKREHPY
uniref:SCP domain-containing protein n=1 Tax=Oryza punctata TaxID=4537 RepID=A0A0E0LIW1_ORYPU